jgi:hypothetical protein
MDGVVLRTLLFRLRLLDHPKRFFPVGNVGDRLAYTAPFLAPVGPDQERAPQGDVTVFVPRLMQQAVPADYLGAGIAEDREFFLGGLFPNIVCMLLIVNADGNKPDAGFVQLVTVPRELAQFGHAVRSPISAVKVQQNPVAVLIGQPEVFAILVFEREVRRNLPDGGRRLSRRIGLALSDCDCGCYENEENRPNLHDVKDTRACRWLQRILIPGGSAIATN